MTTIPKSSYSSTGVGAAQGLGTANNTKSAAADNSKKSSISNSSEEELQTLELDKNAETSSISENNAVDQIKKKSEQVQKEYEEQIKEYMAQIQRCYVQIDDVNNQRRNLLSDMTNPDVDTTKIMTSFNEINQQKTKIYADIEKILLNIDSLEDAIKENSANAANAIEELQNLQTQYSSLSKNANSSMANITALDTNSDVGQLASQMGKSFIGVINNDAQGNAEFSPGGASQHWCADFVTAITKRAYQAKGLAIPSGFGSSSVSGLQGWAASASRWGETKNMSAAQKAQWIVQNVKPGDIMIEKEGMSHTGIVTKVNPDGSFETIEGNSSDAVKARSYPASNSHLTGFIKMS